MDLIHKKCVPCKGGDRPMTHDEIQTYLGAVSDWTLIEEKEIRKDYVFHDFSEALRFVNAVGKIAEEENHHPDILLHDWKKVEIRLSTHAVGGLFINDFVLAAKIDVMWKERFVK